MKKKIGWKEGWIEKRLDMRNGSGVLWNYGKYGGVGKEAIQIDIAFQKASIFSQGFINSHSGTEYARHKYISSGNIWSVTRRRRHARCRREKVTLTAAKLGTMACMALSLPRTPARLANMTRLVSCDACVCRCFLGFLCRSVCMYMYINTQTWPAGSIGKLRVVRSARPAIITRLRALRPVATTPYFGCTCTPYGV